MLDLNEPLAVCDADTFYGEDHIDDIKNAKNAVFCFYDDGKDPIYSYVQTAVDNRRGLIERIREKSKISNWASVGTYCFTHAGHALDYCRKVRAAGVTTKGEYYVSSVIQAMIDAGHDFYMHQVDCHDCLGTPAQLQGYDSRKKMRFCFDLDSTLVSEPKIPGDYTSVEPIRKNIDYLKFLSRKGHEIIISTSRRMKTHHGNVNAAVADIGKLTFDTLAKYDIPYDEIHFGKPYADFYIDDKAVNAWGDLEKLTGFYQEDMVSRAHNMVTEVSGCIVKSSAKPSIRGELYWYLNMPTSVSDLFPKLNRHSETDGLVSLELERIDGPTFSKMLTIGSLKSSHIDELCDALSKIHATGPENTSINISDNYFDKCEKRFHSWSDEADAGAHDLYRRIEKFLGWYVFDSGATKLCNIHGDPVFTNIIVDKHNRVKMIDMRGLQGNVETLSGDINYDYAKVYQSLRGYDFIIRDMSVKEKVLKPLRDRFMMMTCASEKIIAGIAASLIFSCIPLQPASIRNRLLVLANDCAESAGLHE